MLTYYSGDADESSSSSSSRKTVNIGGRSMGDMSADMMLSREDIRKCKEEAVRSVRVPPSVIQLITDLRTYLQEKTEPPVYVSDRRLVKSIQLLQVCTRTHLRNIAWWLGMNTPTPVHSSYLSLKS